MLVNRGPSCPVSVYVMVGPQCAADDADGWASWNVLTNNHAMPIVPAEHCRFAGESGATAFLRELPSYGVMPIVDTMRDWRSFVTRGGRREAERRRARADASPGPESVGDRARNFSWDQAGDVCPRAMWTTGPW